MQEASELLSNMKNMPGMGNLSSMLSQLGMKGMGGLGGKGGKVNIGAMQSHLQQNMKNAKMKERMHQKLQERQQQQPQQRPATSVYTASSGESIVQTPRVAPKPTTNQLPADAISQAESNLLEWAQVHMKPSQGAGDTGQKKKKKNKNKNKK